MGEDGFGRPHFSTRYQFIPIMSAFADIYFPIGDDSLIGTEEQAFNAGLQFSTQFSPLLNFGSELGACYSTYGKDDIATLCAFVDTELDFAVTPSFTPYISADVNVKLGGFDKDEGYKLSIGNKITYIELGVGTKYDINQIVSLDASVGFDKLLNRKDAPTFIIAKLAALFNFQHGIPFPPEKVVKDKRTDSSF